MEKENYVVIYGERFEISEDVVAEIKEKLCAEEETKMTYDKVADKLFIGERLFYINELGYIKESNNSCSHIAPNNAQTEEQLESLLCLNKLINVAVFLNDGWKPNWDNELENKHYHYLDSSGEIDVDFAIKMQSSNVYFKSKDLVKKATEILGEECIRKALTLNW